MENPNQIKHPHLRSAHKTPNKPQEEGGGKEKHELKFLDLYQKINKLIT